MFRCSKSEWLMDFLGDLCGIMNALKGLVFEMIYEKTKSVYSDRTLGGCYNHDYHAGGCFEYVTERSRSTVHAS